MSGAILQANDVADKADVTDIADVIIIGSGAGGATAARVLTERGLDVIVVEEGPSVPVEERTVDAYASFRRLWRDAGFQVARGRAFLPVLQGSCVGGTTVINGAIIHRLPESVHATWVREHGVGTVVRYDELTNAWDALDKELSVGPAPEETLGDNNRFLRTATRNLGISGQSIRRNVHNCQGSSRCNQGCPTGRKQSFDLTFLPYAVERGARIYATCKVTRIVTKGGRAIGIEGSFSGGKTVLRAQARRAVIVAAGAIHTPLLLQQCGVGKASGLVGKRLQAHPATSVLGVFDQPVRMGSGATQGFETLAYWDQRMKFETAAVPAEILATRLPGFGADLVENMASAAHVAQWGVEVRAEAHGQVRSGIGGKPDIRYDLGDSDVRILKKGVKTLIRLYFAAGAREVMPGVHGLPARTTDPNVADRLDALPDDPRLFHAITGHVFGTATMGENPSRSVVRPDGRTHDLEGLYVLDASIFPTNIGVNPQHSIAGLVWVLSHRLAFQFS